jgi:hypothetical protein
MIYKAKKNREIENKDHVVVWNSQQQRTKHHWRHYPDYKKLEPHARLAAPIIYYGVCFSACWFLSIKIASQCGLFQLVYTIGKKSPTLVVMFQHMRW